MTTYRVTFARIGRNHNVAPMTVDADGPNHLAEAIYYYATPHLLSRDVDISVDLATGQGQIFAGFNNGGTFTVEPTETAECKVPRTARDDGSCEGPVSFEVVVRSSDRKQEHSRTPGCFKHAMAEADRAHAAGSIAAVDVEPIVAGGAPC